MSIHRALSCCSVILFTSMLMACAPAMTDAKRAESLGTTEPIPAAPPQQVEEPTPPDPPPASPDPPPEPPQANPPAPNDGTPDTIPADASTLRDAKAELAASDFSIVTAEEVDGSSYGLIGDGQIDNTSVFQRLLAGGNRTIHVRPGDYVTRSLFFEANTVLILEPGVTVRDAGTLGLRDRLFNIRSTHHVRIVGLGARIVAQRADYPAGEQRHGVLIFGSSHVLIEGLESTGHGGDGFYIGGPTGSPATDVILKGCKADNNQRQGLSITSARRVHIVDCEFSYTNGTAPEFGVDLEPNYPTDVMDQITLLRVRTHANRGGGIMIYLNKLDGTSEPADISMIEHVSTLESPSIFTAVPSTVSRTIRYSSDAQ